MGYTHYFRQRKAIPIRQWERLQKAIATLFPLLSHPNPSVSGLSEPIVICDWQGKNVIEHAEGLFVQDEAGNDIIEFNGLAAKEFDHETFVLSRCSSDEWFCKTAHKPYDCLVVAVLILTHNLCPGCYSISSDGIKQEWAPVLRWLNRHLDTRYRSPV